MLRPNARSLERMAELDRFIVNGPPCRAVSLHVRHGDKYIEMKVHHFKEYLEKAELIFRMTGENEPDGLRTIFLATADSQVIAQLHKFSASWEFHYLNETRTNYENEDWFHDQGVERVLRDLTTLRHHASCIAFVGTFGSNWSRLIHQVRSTLALRNDAPTYDLTNKCLGYEDCLRKGKKFDFQW